jgi:hypothetical protein
VRGCQRELALLTSGCCNFAFLGKNLQFALLEGMYFLKVNRNHAVADDAEHGAL